MKYIVYITINLCNGKFYIGVHKTNPDIFDGYIGNGIYRASNVKPKINGFHAAVKKYGYNNFKRTTIQEFPDTEEGMKQAYILESQIVTNILIKSNQCYNTAVGGQGSTQEETKKRVYMFSLNGNFLRSYDCVGTAVRDLNIPDFYNAVKAIRNNCIGVSNSSYGYYWSYKKQFNYQESTKLKKINQYTQEGIYIKTFDSITQAEEELQLNSIFQAINKGYLCGGFQWKYYNGNTDNISPKITVANKNKILPIIMQSKDTTIVKEYSSIQECVKDNSQLKASQINRVLKGIIKSHMGFTFKYKNEDIV